MEADTETVVLDGWVLTRTPGASVSGSKLMRGAEQLRRFAEAESYKAMVQLHDEAQLAVPPHLESLKTGKGMGISLRTGKIVMRAATETACQEISFIRGISSMQALQELDRAETLTSDQPEVLATLAAGRIGATHVQRIVDQARGILAVHPPRPASDAAEAEKEEWERKIAAEAARVRNDRRDFGIDMLQKSPGKTPSEVRSAGKYVLEKYYGISFTKRSKKALGERTVYVEQGENGMSTFVAYLPSAHCEAIFNLVDGTARTLKQHPPKPRASAEPGGDPSISLAAPVTAGPELGMTGAAGNARVPGAMTENADASAQVVAAHPEAANAAEAGVADDHADVPSTEQRSMDQLRADVFSDMMLVGPNGSGLENVKSEVFITIPASMLPGLPGAPTENDATPTDGPPFLWEEIGAQAAVRGTADETENMDRRQTTSTPDADAVRIGDGLLPAGAPLPTVQRLGPVDQVSAVKLMANASCWWRVVTDPISGAIVKFGRRRYRLTAAQRAALMFRDRTCRTPGCPMPASRCQPDHNIEWQHGGSTDLSNLSYFCGRCHRLKSLGLLQVRQYAGGVLVVTTLLGSKRTSYPASPWLGTGTDPHDAPGGPNGGALGVGPHGSGPEDEPPPPDPDAEIPQVEHMYYHQSRPDDPPPEGDVDDDADYGLHAAEYDAVTRLIMTELEQHPDEEPPPEVVAAWMAETRDPEPPDPEDPQCGAGTPASEAAQADSREYDNMLAREWYSGAPHPPMELPTDRLGRYGKARQERLSRRKPPRPRKAPANKRRYPTFCDDPECGHAKATGTEAPRPASGCDDEPPF